ncbi:hypothetical protein C0993_012160 [Termitomyces sp. T159_Od127]|nr:hypothetical protein C0993_012160 [Termitomyces sp. T159_Od127]
MEDEKTIAAGPSPLPSLAYTTPARPRSAILDGQLSIRKDGFFTGWRWAARWIVLRNKTLTIYRSQVRAGPCLHLTHVRLTRITQGTPPPAGRVINLDDITKVEVIKSRRLRIHTKSGKRYSLSFRVPEEVHMWRDAISPRIMLPSSSSDDEEISHPWGFVHRQHVGYDPVTGQLQGMPEAWIRILQQPPQILSEQEPRAEPQQPGVAQPAS